MVIPLYFLPILSCLPTNMRKQVTSQQHSIQGDNTVLNMCLSVGLYTRRLFGLATYSIVYKVLNCC